MTAKNKGARDCGPAPFDNATKSNHTPVELLRKLERAAWIAAYSVEVARQRYADRRQLFRQAGACLALALLRLAGVRYV